VNVTDPDSKLGHGMRGWIQGYNAQAARNERRLIVAAKVMTASPDFGHLGPMVDATRRELAAAGVASKPDVVVGDAGYWHVEQDERHHRRRHPGAHPARLNPPTQDGHETRLERRRLTSCAGSSRPSWAATSSAASSSSRSDQDYVAAQVGHET
jgi:hypothetical protein